MSQTEEKKPKSIKKHWKKIALGVSVGLFIIYSIYSVESSRELYNNEPEKVYKPIFVSEEEIQKLKDRATIPANRDNVPFVDYEKIYRQVKQSKILFEKLGKNSLEVSEFCKLIYSYNDNNEIVAKPNCFSLATEQEKIGIKNSFFHLLKGKPGFYIEEKPIEEIIEKIIDQKIEENKTSEINSNTTGKQLEFTLREKVGITGR